VLKFLLIAGLICSLAISAQAAPQVRVTGLFGGSAVLMINGKQRLLKAGKTSPEGVLLIEANNKGALIDINGQRQFLSLSKQIGSQYQKTETTEIRLASSHGGHYVTPARINNQPVRVMVDTGATSVAMNLGTARKLGINYRAGRKVSFSTANGTAQGYIVMLDSVSVGNVKVDNVEGAIMLGDSPTTILLGNSYLSRVDMSNESGVMVLKSKF